MAEIYKIANGIALQIMNSLSAFWNNKYIIRNFHVLSTDFRWRVNFKIETVTYSALSL